MKRHLVLIVLVVGLLMIGFVANQSVMAQETGIALGLGVGAAPDYEGSEDYEAVPIPYVNVRWSNHMSINWLGNKAKVNLIPSPIWKAGVVGEYIPERDDVDNNRVDRLEDVDTSLMFGGFFTARIYAGHIGLAFQVADDILNVKGDPEQMGKAIGTDQIRGKNTYPSLLGLAGAEALAGRLVNYALKALDTFDNREKVLPNLLKHFQQNMLR